MLQKTSHYMRQANLIGGEWVDADSGATLDVTNPANGQTIGTVPKSGTAETRRAIEAAEKAFKSWKKTSANERSKLLRRLHDLLRPGGRIVAEVGAPGSETRVISAQISHGDDHTDWFPWAVVGADGIRVAARSAGVDLRSIRRSGDRWFATLQRP